MRSDWKWILSIFLLLDLTLPAAAQHSNPAAAANDAGASKKVVFIGPYCDSSGTARPDFSMHLLQGWGVPPTGGKPPDYVNDPTVITGLNDANYSLRHPNLLANFEALMNVLANSLAVLALLYGGLTLVEGCFRVSVKCVLCGVAIMATGAAIPGLINWMVCTLRDSSLIG